MLHALSLFAQADGPHTHLTQAPLFNIGPITVTNVMLYGWISLVVLAIVLALVARRVTIRPKAGFIQLIEVLVEFIRGTVEGAFEDKTKARKYTPYFVTLFLIILAVNWLGLLPITRSALTLGEVPLLKPLTASFNYTLAMAAVTMLFVYVSSVRELGVGKFFGHFFVGSPKNPLFFFIGLVEMISDAVRVISLSLRLFLNVAIGEIMIAVFAYLGGVLAPVTALPFFLLEIGVLALQAYIFVILAIMYLAIAVNHGEEHAEELSGEPVPDKINAAKREPANS